MFTEFFKRKKSEVIVNTVEKPKNNNYPEEVLQIHKEFEKAAENFLQQCKKVIEEQPEVNISKIESLRNLGFIQVKEAIEGTSVIEKVELSKEQIDLVNYYQQNYPFNKFITESQVKEICHKYNLVCGDVSRFKGFVPDINLKQIQSFKLKEAEKNVLICRNRKTDEIFVLENAEIRSSYCGNYEHIFLKSETDKYKYAFQREKISKRWSNDDDYFYGGDSKNLFNLKDQDIQFYIETNSLKICAPVKDMDISGLELKEGYKLQKKHIPDPVVLQPVKGGYLILTAWGDEASDPVVVNQNFN